MTVLAMHPILTGLLPELVLVVGASMILLASLGGGRTAAGASVPVALMAVAAAFWATWSLQYGGVSVDSLNDDSLTFFVRLVVLAVGALILLVNRHVPIGSERGEFYALILFSLAGIMLVAVANNLILLFLALELVSVPTYILIGLSRRDIRAQEATGKYFFLGAFAAALTLYGFSFLYGATGTMMMFERAAGDVSIFSNVRGPVPLADSLLILGLVLSLAGLAFKIAAVPLHFYAADVYQGAASPVTGLLGFVPKFAGFIAIIRLLSLFAWTDSDALFWLLWVLAAATMIVGNTLALMQQNVKRMLAYSSIAHSGYMLVALVAGPGSLGAGQASPLRNGLSAILFYMAVYGVMNLGVFAALAFFRKPGTDEEDSAESLSDLSGAARRHPWASLALAVCVLSLMGLPPTGGFLAKVYVFSAALAAAQGSPHGTALIALVIVGVLNAAVAAAYYIRIVASVYLGTPPEGVTGSRCGALRLSLGLCAAIVLATFVWPGALFDRSQRAVFDLQRTRPMLVGRNPAEADSHSLRLTRP